jgi:hypothetical protein
MEEWIEKALTDLRKEVNNNDLEYQWAYGDEYFIATDGNEEYMVFESESEAEDYAIQRVREDLEENPEYFNQDWLSDYIDGNDFFQNVYDEWNNSYANDIQSERGSTYENRLIDEMVEWDIMSEEEAESDDAEEIAEDRIDDFVSALTSDQMDNGGFDYYVDNFGKEEAMKVVLDNGLIDIDDASESAVREDGIAHFLSSYDGMQIDLGDVYNDAVAYRIN